MPIPYSPTDYQYVIFIQIMADRDIQVYMGASDEETAHEWGKAYRRWFPCWYGAKYFVKHKDDCTEYELSKISIIGED